MHEGESCIHVCVCAHARVCVCVCVCVCVFNDRVTNTIYIIGDFDCRPIGAVLLLEMFFLTQSCCFLHCHYKLHREPPHPQCYLTQQRGQQCACAWAPFIDCILPRPHPTPLSSHPSGLLWFDMTGSALSLLTQAWIKPVLPFPQCRAFLWVFSDLELDIMLCG